MAGEVLKISAEAQAESLKLKEEVERQRQQERTEEEQYQARDNSHAEYLPSVDQSFDEEALAALSHLADINENVTDQEFRNQLRVIQGKPLLSDAVTEAPDITEDHEHQENTPDKNEVRIFQVLQQLVETDPTLPTPEAKQHMFRKLEQELSTIYQRAKEALDLKEGQETQNNISDEILQPVVQDIYDSFKSRQEWEVTFLEGKEKAVHDYFKSVGLIPKNHSYQEGVTHLDFKKALEGVYEKISNGELTWEQFTQGFSQATGIEESIVRKELQSYVHMDKRFENLISYTTKALHSEDGESQIQALIQAKQEGNLDRFLEENTTEFSHSLQNIERQINHRKHIEVLQEHDKQLATFEPLTLRQIQQREEFRAISTNPEFSFMYQEIIKPENAVFFHPQRKEWVIARGELNYSRIHLPKDFHKKENAYDVRCEVRIGTGANEKRTVTDLSNLERASDRLSKVVLFDDCLQLGQFLSRGENTVQDVRIKSDFMESLLGDQTKAEHVEGDKHLIDVTDHNLNRKLNKSVKVLLGQEFLEAQTPQSPGEQHGNSLKKYELLEESGLIEHNQFTRNPEHLKQFAEIEKVYEMYQWKVETKSEFVDVLVKHDQKFAHYPYVMNYQAGHGQVA